MKPSALQSLPQLLEFAAGQRHNAGIVAVPAHLFRDLVIAAAEAGAANTELTPSEESFLRDACDAVDGLRKDFDRPLYVAANRLFRLGRFVQIDNADLADLSGVIIEAKTLEEIYPDDQPEIAGDPDEEPPAKPKRSRKKPPAD